MCTERPKPRLDFWGGKCSEPQSATEHATATSRQNCVQIQYLNPSRLKRGAGIHARACVMSRRHFCCFLKFCHQPFFIILLLSLILSYYPYLNFCSWRLYIVLYACIPLYYPEEGNNTTSHTKKIINTRIPGLVLRRLTVWLAAIYL